jgi:hypothetical protein
MRTAVSERDVELMRGWVGVFNTRDIEALIRLCASDIELHSAFAAVGGTVYHGHDGMRTWHRDLEDAWGDEIRLEYEAYFDLGEQTLGFYVYHGRGKHSGAEVAMPAAAVARWRDGLMAYTKVYLHRDDALRELDVTEDELEPIAP